MKKSHSNTILSSDVNLTSKAAPKTHVLEKTSTTNKGFEVRATYLKPDAINTELIERILIQVVPNNVFLSYNNDYNNDNLSYH